MGQSEIMSRKKKTDSDLRQVLNDIKRIMGVYYEVFNIYSDEITLCAHPTEEQLEEIRKSIRALGYSYIKTEEKLEYFIGNEEDYFVTEIYKKGIKTLGLVYIRYEFPLRKTFQLKDIYVEYDFRFLKPIKLISK
jgi:hypothetical protein